MRGRFVAAAFVAGALIAGLVVGGVAIAQTGGDETVTGCLVAPWNGIWLIGEGAEREALGCPGDQTAVTWNKEGMQGPQGPPGSPGTQSFVVSAFENVETSLTTTPTAFVSVQVAAPVAGHVTVSSTAAFFRASAQEVDCEIVEATEVPALLNHANESYQVHAPTGFGSLSGTRTFAIEAGATVDYVLACRGAGPLFARNLTAIFTPAP